MKFTLKASILAALGAAALTGCSAPAAAPASPASTPEAAAVETPTETAEPRYSLPPESAYPDIDSLMQAFVEAGGTCKDFFKPQLVSALPIESGVCGTDSGAAQMYRFFTEDKRDQYVANNRAVSPAAGLPVHLVVGDLWVIDSPQAAKVADALGGALITK